MSITPEESAQIEGFRENMSDEVAEEMLAELEQREETENTPEYILELEKKYNEESDTKPEGQTAEETTGSDEKKVESEKETAQRELKESAAKFSKATRGGLSTGGFQALPEFIDLKVSSGDTTSICGYAYLSGPNDRVIMDNDCGDNTSTLAHELGHYFSLLHTHSTSNGDELVDGSNCLNAGDLFCDTPADPRLSSSIVNSLCV